MEKDTFKSFFSLKKYCEAEHFKGWDPYDGLNSRLFQSLPFLKHSAICRLVVIQGFKRCPINLRRIALVPKEHNAKGIGLFLSGYCNLYRVIEKESRLADKFGDLQEIKSRIIELADLLITLQSKGYSGACWGYNFDWQARRLFFFPKNTPTVVATNFCATALMEAYEITKKESYLNIALSAADFVINDLHRTPCNNGILFSYSPLKGNDTVFNASLLGSRLLSYCYYYTHEEEYRELAEQSVRACCRGQRKDGAWVYGMLPLQNWVDSFHTGYNLDALIAYQELTDDTSYRNNIDKGFEYYITHFFEAVGTPKYYDNKTYPIDIHCPGQLFVTLARLHKTSAYVELAEKVLTWTVKNMLDKKGYFYYQIKPGISSKIPYMRWSNAFMFCALSYYLRENVQMGLDDFEVTKGGGIADNSLAVSVIKNHISVMQDDNRVTLNGVKVFPFTSFEELLACVSVRKGILVAINAEKILHATPQTRGIINRNIGYCDGFGAVMALKKHGFKKVIKLPGCELWLKIIKSLSASGKTFYLVGGKQRIIESTVEKLRKEFAGINIVGFRNGYIKTETERNALLDDITVKAPDVVFVAMGSPKQELLMEQMFKRHPAIYQGLGGSFDVYTGNVKRAPKWWVNHNLEFAYRLIKQPSRIKRQIHLAKYAWCLICDKI